MNYITVELLANKGFARVKQPRIYRPSTKGGLSVARTRSIKPAFFNNEDLGGLPPLTRLLGFNDSNLRKLCLCRVHHMEAHQIGRNTFEQKYHVYGIIFKE